MGDLLEKPCAWPPLARQRLLVVGIGGGSDIIMAYAISLLLKSKQPAETVYANTKRRADAHLHPVSDHVWQVSDWRPDLSPSEDTHGTSAIDHCVPRGDRGCPLIFVLMERESEPVLVREIAQLGFGQVIAVDTGGDSLVEGALSGPEGRDQRMLRVLQATGLPITHVVAAPCSDGESTYEQMLQAFESAKERCLGFVDLDPVLPVISQLAAGLPASRTPNIITAAAERRLKCTRGSRCVVPRGIWPEVPREWLMRAYAFSCMHLSSG